MPITLAVRKSVGKVGQREASLVGGKNGSHRVKQSVSITTLEQRKSTSAQTQKPDRKLPYVT